MNQTPEVAEEFVPLCSVRLVKWRRLPSCGSCSVLTVVISTLFSPWAVKLLKFFYCSPIWGEFTVTGSEKWRWGLKIHRDSLTKIPNNDKILKVNFLNFEEGMDGTCERRGWFKLNDGKVGPTFHAVSHMVGLRRFIVCIVCDSLTNPRPAFDFWFKFRTLGS